MNAHLAYLETEVTTASQPKLRLMLIEAALRLAHQSLQCWEESLPDPAFRPLSSLRKIILELFTSVETDDCQLVANIQSLYLYLFRTVTEAQLAGDAQKIRDVVRILEIERETWRVLTQRFVSEGMALEPLESQPPCASAIGNVAPRSVSPSDEKTKATAAHQSFSILA